MNTNKLPIGSAAAKKKYLERIRLESVYSFSRGVILLTSFLLAVLFLLAFVFVCMMAIKNDDVIKAPFFWPMLIGCPLGVIAVKLSYDAAMVIFDIADSSIDHNHRYDL